MKRHIFLTIWLAFLTAALAPVASAQFSKLDGLAKQLSAKLKKQNAHTVLVEKFEAPDGTASVIGEYFADFFAAGIKSHEKKLEVLLHRREKAVVVGETDPSAAGASEPENTTLGNGGYDYRVTGTTEVSANSYTIHVVAQKANTSSVLFEQSVVIQRTEFTDSLTEEFPPKTDYPVFRPRPGKVDAKRIPQCVFCPIPEYSDYARTNRLQGTCVFEVLISANGKAEKLHLVKRLGSGLDEKGFYAIKMWRFRPATDENGNAVATIVPIEVTFRLY